jgi:O-methyltransferase
MAIHKGLSHRLRAQAQRVLSKTLLTAMASRYTFIVPQAQRVYTPWYEKTFLERTALPASRTLLTTDRLWLLSRMVEHCRFLPGAMAECGVYKGGSARLIAETLVGADVELHLFDTFEGMPGTAQVRDSVSKGDFGDTGVAAVSALLAPFRFAKLHQGFIPDTFAGLENKTFSFVHVDVDIYSTTLDCLRFFYPRMCTGGIVLFDDYSVRIYERAEKAAVDEFFADKREKPFVLSNGQAFVIKL